MDIASPDKITFTNYIDEAKKQWRPLKEWVSTKLSL